MLYFNPKPNYKRISKYYSWPGTPEQMEEHNPDGYLIAIDWIQTKEEVLRIEKRFGEICHNYNLTDFQDDLLLLLLTKYKQTHLLIVELEDERQRCIRIKELASLLLLVKQTKSNKFTKLSIATVFDTIKISDSALIEWIGNSIIQMIEAGDYPVSLLGITADELLDGSENDLTITKLKQASNISIESSPRLNEHKANLCLYLHKYLITETNIKPDPNTWFSDSLLNFYFDTLELFGYNHRIDIGSDPKDYLRSLLWNRLKQINPSLSRK